MLEEHLICIDDGGGGFGILYVMIRVRFRNPKVERRESLVGVLCGKMDSYTQ